MTDLLTLRLTDPDFPDGVPVDDLARVLGALQKLTHLAARMAAPTLRPNAEFKRRYGLRAAPTPDGGLAIAMGPRQLSLALELGTAPVEVAASLARWFRAVAERDAGALLTLVAEPVARRRWLREVARALPRSTDHWSAVMHVAGAAPIRLGAAEARWLDGRLAALAPTGPLMMTVTGELVGVDFGRGTFSLRYAPTGRVLDGRYAPEDEVALLKLRRKLVHVSGEVAVDEEDHPVKLRRVVKVTAVDLSPVTVGEVRTPDGRAFALVPPLSLVPVMDAESQQAYELEDAGLDLYVTAPTREALESEVEAHVAAAAADPTKAWKRRLTPLLAITAD